MDAIFPVDTSDVDNNVLNNPSRLRADSITQTTLTNENELQSTDSIEPVIQNSQTTSTGFDVNHVYEAFVNALKEPENPKSPISTQDYINGYRELIKFFDQLGYVFKFVKDDVVQKLTILQDFVDKDTKRSPNFDTIQKGINYEAENNLIKTNSENFARTLLRLHRALLFIEEFLRGLTDRPDSDSTVTIATDAYDSTLYNHHNFLIRGTVKVGFRILPARKNLDEIIFRGQKSEKLGQYKTFIQTIKRIYDIIQDYYTEKNYLQLP